MRPIPGAPPVDISELVRAQDRVSFVYVGRCIVNRQDNAITVQDERGTVHLPAATLGALLLGPGSNVTHQAMTLLAESGSTAVWVGERGVRYYAHGRGLSHSTHLLEAQAVAVTNQSSRLRVARAMYQLRFPDEDVTRATMQQLRGREGARVRRLYRAHAERTGIQWTKRDYEMGEFASATPINQAISSATTCLYGLAHAVIVSLGCSPALGFVHTGHARSFVYDVADLYKAEVAIPIAFEVAAQEPDDVPAITRRAVRDAVHDGRLLKRCVRDIRRLLLPDADDAEQEWNVVRLWDGGSRTVSGGTSYDEAEPPW